MATGWQWRIATALLLASGSLQGGRPRADDSAFYEKHIRPLLVRRCYECHSEESRKQEGGLLLDRAAGWLTGGDSGPAVVPGQVDESLLIQAVRHEDASLQMPPERRLTDDDVSLLEQWVRRGAAGPADDVGETEFSRLGDQERLFGEAERHWAFQPVVSQRPPESPDADWNRRPIDRFIFSRLAEAGLTPSPPADARSLIRRLHYSLTGLPPTAEQVAEFSRAAGDNRQAAVAEAVDRLLATPAYGEHMARLWLDVARYADTDSFYRPDTRTPHRFPFAFAYRDYVIRAFETDKPYDQFLREQLAADLLGLPDDADLAALGFLAVGPYANRNPQEALDDWIDATTRGLMGLTVACARCHDHKYEPVPTADYYSLRGVFASVTRIPPLDEAQLPPLPGHAPAERDVADYLRKRAAIDAKIAEAGGRKAANNNQSIAQKIRETELAELLALHPGAPAYMMVVEEKRRPDEPYVYLRGEAGSRGPAVPRRFLQLLDPQQAPFPSTASGRLELAEKIADPRNPLTARVLVNRVWGWLHGGHLVDTPSDFGLQGAAPSHPRLLDWLTDDFVSHGWSVKRLVREIVLSEQFQQTAASREEAAAVDRENQLRWRADRRPLTIEALRDSMLAVAGRLDLTVGGRPEPLWGDRPTRRRAIYGYINRFNLDPTLRAFDFPTPMQSQGGRDASIVPAQALFVLNSPFVIEQAAAIVESASVRAANNDRRRVAALFAAVLQRAPDEAEAERVLAFVEGAPATSQDAAAPSRWALAAQALLMSNEFRYLD